MCLSKPSSTVWQILPSVFRPISMHEASKQRETVQLFTGNCHNSLIKSQCECAVTSINESVHSKQTDPAWVCAQVCTDACKLIVLGGRWQTGATPLLHTEHPLSGCHSDTISVSPCKSNSKMCHFLSVHGDIGGFGITLRMHPSKELRLASNPQMLLFV